MAVKAKSGKLSDIRKRLKEGTLTKADISALEQIVKDAETATKNLRAAIVE